MGDTEQEISRMVLSFLQNSEEDLEVAIEVDRALRALRLQLPMDFGNSILKQLKQTLGGGWEVSSDFGSPQYPGLKIRRNNWPQGNNRRGAPRQCWVGFQFNAGSWGVARYGLSCHQNIVTGEMWNHLRVSVREKYSELHLSPESWAAQSNDLAGIPTDWMSDDFLRFATRWNSGATPQVSIVNSFIERLICIAHIVDRAFPRPGLPAMPARRTCSPPTGGTEAHRIGQ